MLGEAPDPTTRGCTVAVGPVRLVCLRRVDHSALSGECWPVVNHIVVALDIAQDRARGLEALEQWRTLGSPVLGDQVTLFADLGRTLLG